MRRDRTLRFFLMLLLAACLCGCADSATKSAMDGAVKSVMEGAAKSEAKSEEKPGEPRASYKAPAFADAAFHEDQAEGDDRVKVDVSAVSQGYVAVTARSDKRIKLRVSMGDVNYDYDVANDGTPCIFPLQSGDGPYSFKVMEQVEDNNYAKLYSVDCEVVMDDEFQPFLRPSEYSKYSAESECVRMAAQLAAAQEDALGVVGAVFDYICETVTYDREKAAAVAGTSGYMPVPDDTLATKQGICFDYASLAAAMLRSQGIPTKIVFGYVSPNDLYHAWNMFYTAESGWVSVGYDVEAGNWYRMDATFSAGGAGNDFVGDGENYADAKYY